MRKEGSPEKVVQEIRRETRRRFSAEEKIRIVLEGLRGEDRHPLAAVAAGQGVLPPLPARGCDGTVTRPVTP